jgi:hypothetical protein
MTTPPFSRPGLLIRAWNKMRHGLFLERAFAGLSKVGFTIFPYYIVLEGLSRNHVTPVVDGIDRYRFLPLGPEHMKEVGSIPGRQASESDLLKRIEKGKQCLGIEVQGRIIAFTWFDLKECNMRIHKFPMKENEAYLFDAYTIVPFRGKGIAPYMRYRCYEALNKLGRDRLYSISSYFNSPALRLKDKLGGERIELRLYLSLFKKWRRDFLLIQYSGIEN